MDSQVKYEDGPFDFSRAGIKSPYTYRENPYAEAYKKYANMRFAGAVYGDSFSSWAYSDSLSPYGSYGNWSAMRVSPIAAKYDVLDDVLEKSVQSAAATHNHIEGIKGGAGTAVMIWMAENGYSKDQIFSYMLRLFKNSHTSLKDFSMEELKKFPADDMSCRYCVPTAVICFKNAGSCGETIANAISFEGDSDTIACIAGGIAAAYYGIPEKVRKTVNENKPKAIFNEMIAKF